MEVVGGVALAVVVVVVMVRSNSAGVYAMDLLVRGLRSIKLLMEANIFFMPSLRP